ncbi:MAG: HIRAN domain-containing protein [Anaerostipes sp.]|nr:HIRAN domain-containing protein [Anaerostipes sp.]
MSVKDMRKSVTTMANKLHKLGYTLSAAFKKAWRRVKQSMTMKVYGTTYENRQELLRFIQGTDKRNLVTYLRRDKENRFDNNAIAVVVEIKNVGFAVIGYLSREVSKTLSPIMDKGIELNAQLLDVIGGYSYKETLGALINIRF